MTTFDLNALPDDLPLLKELVRDLAGRVHDLDGLVARLRHELAVLRRHQFGRRSETIDPGQLWLAFTQAQGEAQPPRALLPAPAPEAKKGHGRRRLPAELPREGVEHTLPPGKQVCTKCGGTLEKIGEEVSEQVDWHPASLFVRQHRRAKYACRQCEESVVLAPMPQQPIEKGLPGAGLLAHVAVSKFEDHIPLYRQEHIFGRHGLLIPRSTLCGWLGYEADLLDPIVREMIRRVLQSKVIHTDDTPVPVLDETLEGRTRTGRLWAYLGDDEHPYTVYAYSPTRERKWPEGFLGDWRGYLQADAFAGYDAMYTMKDITEVACWAHARRKFYNAQTTDRERASVALRLIQLLYDVERTARRQGMGAAGRRTLRQEKARPLLDQLRAWLLAEVGVVLPKSPLGEAIGYALDQWTALTRYLDDGDLDIDNNAAERALRGVAVGRKNWLFVGSDWGGRRAAILYSLIASSKRHRVDPFAYLRDVLERVSTTPARAIATLLPDQWKAAQEALRTPPTPEAAAAPAAAADTS